jgi:SulP family sulfate permease
MTRFFDLSHLRGDIFGGLTAGVVALPLALAFGEASGAGPIAGVYGAILVGFFAALFGGTPSQISGPTGPMIVVFAGVFASLSGDLLAGLCHRHSRGADSDSFGVLGFGQYIRLVPYPVVSGFMSGIGCIIIALQLARLFGHEPAGRWHDSGAPRGAQCDWQPERRSAGNWRVDPGHSVFLAS